jgi:DNA-binding SARP family transcriptional activator
MDVRLLGPVELVVRERSVPVAGTSPRAVLAMLALRAGQVVRTDEIIEGLWAGTFPLDPGAAVQVTLSRVRRALGEERERLRHIAAGYVLDLDPTAVDVGRVEAALDLARQMHRDGRREDAARVATDGLGEWRSDAPLAEFADLPFAAAPASRLQVLRSELAEIGNAAALDIGHPEEVIARTPPLIELDPWRENLVAQLMTALYQTGRQAEALSAFAQLASRLRADFGVEPSPPLSALRTRVLAHDPRLRGANPSRIDDVTALPRWFRSAVEGLGQDEHDQRLLGRLKLALGEAEHHAGVPGWQGTLLEAAALARASGDTIALARCALAGALGWNLTPGEPDRRRLMLLQEALEDDTLDDALRARLLAVYAIELTFAAPIETRLRASDDAVALARASGQPPLLLDILNQRFNAIWAPETLDARRLDAAEATRIAEAGGNPLPQIIAAGFSMAACVESGDIETADHHLRRFTTLADELDLGVFRWGVLVHSSWRAVIADELDRASSVADEARRAGIEAARPEAELIHLFQRIAVHWATGRLGEHVDQLGMLRDALQTPAWLDSIRAVGLLSAGDTTAAHDELTRAWQTGAIGALPHDQMYLATLVHWSEVAAATADVDIADGLAALLAPFGDRLVFTGAAVYGPVAYALGQLAAAAGDGDRAAEHFEVAMRMARTLRSPLFLHRAEQAMAHAGQ